MSLFQNDIAGLPRGGAPGERWAMSTRPQQSVINIESGPVQRPTNERESPRRGKKRFVQIEEEANILGNYDQAPRETLRVLPGSGTITNAQNTLVDGFSRAPAATAASEIYQNGAITTYQPPPKKRMTVHKSYTGKNVLTMDYGEDHLRVGGATESPYVPSAGQTYKVSGHALPLLGEEQIQRMERTRQMQAKPSPASPLGFSSLRGAGNHIFSHEEAPLTKAQAQEKWIEQKNLAMGIHKKAGPVKRYVDPSEWVDPLDSYVPGKNVHNSYQAISSSGTGAFVETDVRSFGARPFYKDLPLPPTQHNPWVHANKERTLKEMTMSVENANSSTPYHEELQGVDQSKYRHTRSGKITGDDILEHRLAQNMNKPDVIFPGARAAPVVVSSTVAPPEMFDGNGTDVNSGDGHRGLDGGDGMQGGQSNADSSLLAEARERLTLQSLPSLEELKHQGDARMAEALRNVGFTPDERMTIMWELRRIEQQQQQSHQNFLAGGQVGNRAIGGGIGGDGVPGGSVYRGGGVNTSYVVKPERGYLQNAEKGIESFLVVNNSRSVENNAQGSQEFDKFDMDNSSPWQSRFSNGLTWNSHMED